MKKYLFAVVIFFCSPAFGQKNNYKIKLFAKDDTNIHFYSPVFITETFHRGEGIGNLYKPADSINDVKVFRTGENMDDSMQDSLVMLCNNKKNQLKIIVDTSQSSVKEIKLYFPFQLDKVYSSYPRRVITRDRNNKLHCLPVTGDTLITVIAQPVFIANLSGYTKYLLGYDGNIEITQQAKDKNNKWIDIETTTPGACSMGKYIYELKRNDFVLTNVFKFKGGFKTDLRIKLEANGQTYYSNTFTGFINYFQLKNPNIKLMDGEAYEKL